MKIPLTIKLDETIVNPFSCCICRSWFTKNKNNNNNNKDKFKFLWYQFINKKNIYIIKELLIWNENK